MSMLPDTKLPSFTEDDTEIICVEKCPDRDVSVREFYDSEKVSLCRYDVEPYVDDIKKCPKSPVSSQ